MSHRFAASSWRIEPGFSTASEGVSNASPSKRVDFVEPKVITVDHGPTQVAVAPAEQHAGRNPTLFSWFQHNALQNRLLTATSLGLDKRRRFEARLHLWVTKPATPFALY